MNSHTIMRLVTIVNWGICSSDFQLHKRKIADKMSAYNEGHLHLITMVLTRVIREIYLLPKLGNGFNAGVTNKWSVGLMSHRSCFLWPVLISKEYLVNHFFKHFVLILSYLGEKIKIMA
jgi:hypothetical protein